MSSISLIAFKFQTENYPHSDQIIPQYNSVVLVLVQNMYLGRGMQVGMWCEERITYF